MTGDVQTTGGDSALAREAERARLVREAEHREAVRQAEQTAAAREAARQDYNASEQGATRAQQVEADRVMRLKTPDTLEEIGSVPPKDPSRFPSD